MTKILSADYLVAGFQYIQMAPQLACIVESHKDLGILSDNHLSFTNTPQESHAAKANHIMHAPVNLSIILSTTCL